MNIAEIELTDEQIEKIKPLVNSRPNYGSWVIVAQIKIKDKDKGWDKTVIRAGLVTGLEAEELTDHVNDALEKQRDKYRQVEII